MARKPKEDQENVNVKEDATLHTEPHANVSAFALTGTLFEDAPTPGRGRRLGSRHPITEYVYANDRLQAQDQSSITIPGIATIRWFPTFGIASDVNDVINKAAVSLYKATQMAMRNRNLPFAASDEMIILCAIDSLHLLYRMGLRIMHAINLYNSYSLYIPADVVKACGGDYDTWHSNLANIKEEFSIWRRELMKFPIPKVFNFMAVHESMTSDIFADAVSEKAQLYVCKPTHVWSYANVDEVKGLQAVAVEDPDTGVITWNAYKELMDSLLASVKYSNDFDIISTAIASTYEEGNYVDLPDYTEGATCDVKHDPVFLTALCNTTPYKVADVNAFRLEDAGAWLTCGMDAKLAPTTVDGDWIVPAHMFNTITDRPSGTEMVNYARWHVVVEPGDDGFAKPISCGTEWVEEIQFLGAPVGSLIVASGEISAGTIGVSAGNNGYSYAINAFASASTYMEAMAQMFVASAFKWHPILWYPIKQVVADSTSPTTTFTAWYMLPITQWNFGFNYSADDIQACHTALLESAINGA